MTKKMPIPNKLKGHAREIFKEAIAGDYHDIEIPTLLATCRLYQEWDRAMSVLETQGALYESVRGTKQRPEVSIARDCWKAFLAGMKALGLDASSEKPKRQVGRPVDSRYAKQGHWTQTVKR